MIFLNIYKCPSYFVTVPKAIWTGTAYLEMALAAFETHMGLFRLPTLATQPIEIWEIYFLSPLIIEEGEKREIRTILKRRQDADKPDDETVDFLSSAD